MKKKNKEIKPYVNTSTEVTTAKTKTFSPTSMKLIAYSLYRLANTFNVDKYKKINLLDKENWTSAIWEDFSCEFSTKDFCDALGIADGGKQRELIEKAIDKSYNRIKSRTIFVPTKNISEDTKKMGVTDWNDRQIIKISDASIFTERNIIFTTNRIAVHTPETMFMVSINSSTKFYIKDENGNEKTVAAGGVIPIVKGLKINFNENTIGEIR